MSQRSYLVLLGICFLFASQASPVLAQTKTPTPKPTLEVPAEQPTTGVNMTLSPVFLNLSVDPGKEITSQFKVTNNNSFKEYVDINVKKFASGAEGPVIQDVTDQDTYTNWVSFSENQFVIEPNQTKTVKFTIAPPESAALGYYYAFVVNRMKPEAGKGSGAAVSGSPALPVLLLVKSPNAKKELQIVDFKTDKVFYEFLPTTFIITAKNTGNVHVAPAGDIFIDSMSKKEVSVLPANKGRGNILPQSQREYRVVWDDGMFVNKPKEENGQVVKKNDKPVYSVQFDANKPLSSFRMGKYTAHLLMIYDNGERDVPIEASVSFWVIPWRFIGIVLGVILLPVVVVIFIGRIRSRKRKNA